jgi:hypothetical protein
VVRGGVVGGVSVGRGWRRITKDEAAARLAEAVGQQDEGIKLLRKAAARGCTDGRFVRLVLTVKGVYIGEVVDGSTARVEARFNEERKQSRDGEEGR